MMIMIYLLAILCGGCQVKAAGTYYLVPTVYLGL
jgi:hypothetical protein